ncbi:MFS transporter [Aquihabitans sp. G128]|uniref:MFS transporter n=1 Tax=Aquihabitans sp. G128 TaxID=2849779 RepID=UPI001C23C1A2|nr:MFS transporter [Aquihabitans sp. G128]QXC61752.1 MFS transporter [Aquihabitans sp. G128]
MTQTPPADPQGAEQDVRDSLADDNTDAFVDGDRTFAPGTARSAFSHATFRTVYLGAFASNIGTWMQNVVLGALAYSLTKSAVFVGIMTAAQLGPLLLFSVVGGMLADAFDRKKLLMVLSVQQAVFSLILAAVTLPHSPNRVAMVAVVFCIGVGNALYAPIFSAVVPVLVPRRDIAGAISLNSVQMNASRVIGPAIGTTLYATFGPSWVFLLNAVSFAFVIASLLRVTLPAPPAAGSQGLHRLLEGVQVAKANRVVGQCLVVIFTFSFLSLPFITQMPKIAGDHLGIVPKSSSYGILYACFGVGAVIGALSIGTVFARASKARLTRLGLLGFAAMLTVFGVLRAAPPAYVVILVLGCVYFAVITSLSTVLQQDLDDGVRGKVMALWIMGFGGTVPFGGLLGGVAMEHFGIGPVLAFGALVAVALAAYADLGDEPPRSRRLALGGQ